MTSASLQPPASWVASKVKDYANRSCGVSILMVWLVLLFEAILRQFFKRSILRWGAQPKSKGTKAKIVNSRRYRTFIFVMVWFGIYPKPHPLKICSFCVSQHFWVLNKIKKEVHGTPCLPLWPPLDIITINRTTPWVFL